MAGAFLVISACGGSTPPPEEDFAWLAETALTPTLPGEWSLVGCEERVLLIGDYVPDYQDGYACTWIGHYGDGVQKERQELFYRDGRRHYPRPLDPDS